MKMSTYLPLTALAVLGILSSTANADRIDTTTLGQSQQQQQASVSEASSAGGNVSGVSSTSEGGSVSGVTATSGDSESSISGSANTNGNSQSINFNTSNDRGRASDPEYVINDNRNMNEIKYSGTYEVKNTPSMGAAPLTTTMSETCMGSTSGAVALAGFGLSGGSTWTDLACVQRLDAREFRAMGLPSVAKERMCGTYENYMAFARAGQPCTLRKDFESRLREETQANEDFLAGKPEPNSNDPLSNALLDYDY